MDQSDSDIDWDFIRQIRARKTRKFQSRKDFLQILDDKNFHKRFRITKNYFRFVLQKIRPKIDTEVTKTIASLSRMYSNAPQLAIKRRNSKKILQNRLFSHGNRHIRLYTCKNHWTRR